MLGRNNVLSRLVALSIATVAASGWLFAAGGDVYQLLDASNLRKGPDSAFEVVTVVEKGEVATELSSKGDWKKVRLGSGESGWIYSPSMQQISTVATKNTEVSAVSTVRESFELNGYGAVGQPAPVVDTAERPLETIDQNAAEVAVVTEPVAADASEVVEIVATDSAVVKTSVEPAKVASEPAEVVNAAPVLTEAAATPAGEGHVAEAFELNGYGVVEQPVPVVDTAQQPLLVIDENTTAVKPAEEAPVQSEVAVTVDDTANGTVYAQDKQPVAKAEMADVVGSDVQQSQPVEPASPALVGGSEEQQLTKTTTIRTGPGVLYEVLGWAGNGAHVVALEAQGKWLKVRMRESGRIGWIEAAALQANAAEQDVMFAGGEPAEAAVIAAQPVNGVEPDAVQSEAAESTVDAADRSGPLEPVQISANTPESIAEVKPERASPEQNLLRFTRKANLRAGPDVKYDVVTWAGIDALATVLDARGDWLKVQMQQSKRLGWVFKSSTALVKAAMPAPEVVKVAEQPVVAAEPEAAVVAEASGAVKLQPVKSDGEAGQLYFFKQTSNLRAGPGKQYDVVAWGARNESASEIARQGEWSRVSMTLSNKVGWVFHSALVAAETAPVTAVAAVKAVTPVEVKPVEVKPVEVMQPVAKSGEMYEVVKTSTLRTDARQTAEINSWVAKGDLVALLQRQDGWARVNPQVDGKQVGWIKTDLLKELKSELHAVSGEHVIGKHNLEEYKNRISHGETFNFSYTALEHALYRVPVEEFYINMDSDDLESVFKKDIYDRSAFDIRMKTKGHTLDKTLLGTVNVLGSSTRVFAKKSLLIKLDKEGGRWYGHRSIALRSMASDKAMMREWMAWKLMAALGMKVPEVHFVRVNFNEGQRVGLYLSIEWMGTNFLAANNMDTNGEFYQPEDAEYCGDLNSTDRIDVCFNKITPQDEDYSTLTEMARAVSTASVDDMHKVMARHFDDESVINWIAVNALVTDGDTYNKNYWLYHDPKMKKWTVIPWDYNLTYGRTYDPYVENPYKTFNDNFQYYYPPDVGASNPLKDHTLRNPHLFYRLQQKIRHLLGLEADGPEATYGWFSPTVMHARIGNLASVVGKELYRDNFITYDEDDFRKSYEALMYYVTAHANFLNQKLFGKYEWIPVDPKAPAVFDPPLPSELYGQGYIKAGSDSVYMTDEGWGLLAGQLVLDRPVTKKTEVKINIEGGQKPRYLPTGHAASRCIQRSWVLSVEPDVTATADMMVEYIQENSRRTEVPVTVHEQELELWMNDGNRWKPLKTEVNEYANTLTARGVPIQSGRTQRFVACSPF